MAENVLFIKRLQLSEVERERAEREKRELLTQAPTPHRLPYLTALARLHRTARHLMPSDLMPRSMPSPICAQWRGQTEKWFHAATQEMQGQLINDWGAAELVRAELRCGDGDPNYRRPFRPVSTRCALGLIGRPNPIYDRTAEEEAASVSAAQEEALRAATAREEARHAVQKFGCIPCTLNRRLLSRVTLVWSRPGITESGG
jgi:hypothetical protein